MMHQCTGQRLKAFILSLFKNGLVFIPLVIILSAVFGLKGIQWTQPLTDSATLLINLPFAIMFLKGLPADTIEEE